MIKFFGSNQTTIGKKSWYDAENFCKNLGKLFS